MPFLELKNASIYYQIEGNGEETIVFAHGLLWSNWMFHKQIDFFKSKYRVIAFDFRGQGQTTAKNGMYDMESLYEDTLELIEKLCGKSVIFAGLSMGGYIGMTVAARRPDLVKKLILMESSCEAETPESIMKYKMLNNLVRSVGYWPVERNIMSLMFGEKFLEDKNRKKEYDFFLKKLKENNRTTIVKATEGVIYRASIEDYLKKIKCPTLVLVGSMDIPCPIEMSRKLVSKIPNSVLEIIEDAGNTGTLEEPEKYNEAIKRFLEND